jgi:hypothetical protein
VLEEGTDFSMSEHVCAVVGSFLAGTNLLDKANPQGLLATFFMPFSGLRVYFFFLECLALLRSAVGL